MWLIYMRKDLIQKKTTEIPKAIDQQKTKQKQFKETETESSKYMGGGGEPTH